jgi:hypothetical protein
MLGRQRSETNSVNSVLPEKLIIAQVAKKLPSYITLMLITVFAEACHCPEPVESIPRFYTSFPYNPF